MQVLSEWIRKSALLAIMVIYALIFLLTKTPSDPSDRLINNEGKGYYAILPAIFIYHDLTYSFLENIERQYYHSTEDHSCLTEIGYKPYGKVAIKNFSGITFLILPFFLIAHLLAFLFSVPDGYSPVYQYAIGFSTYFYLILGLYFTKKLIIRFSGENSWKTALAIAAIALGTNIVYYTVTEGTTGNVFHFFLISVFLLLAHKILQAQDGINKRELLLAAFIFGLIIISQPQNGLILIIIPALAERKAVLLNFTRNLFGAPLLILQAVLVVSSVLLLQLMLWYIQTGALILFPFGYEKFSFTISNVLNLLLSFDKGWFIYTPVALLACLGWLRLLLVNRFAAAWSGIMFMILAIVFSSGSLWHAYSQYGQRVLVDYYAIPAVFIMLGFDLTASKIYKAAFTAFLLLFIVLNLHQFGQHIRHVYPVGPISRETYCRYFFKTSPTLTYYIPAQKKNTEYQFEFPLSNRWNDAWKVNDEFVKDIVINPDKNLPLMVIAYGRVASPYAVVSPKITLTLHDEWKEIYMLMDFYSDGKKISEHIVGFKNYIIPHRRITLQPSVFLPLAFCESDSVVISLQATRKTKLRVHHLSALVSNTTPPNTLEWIPTSLNSTIYFKSISCGFDTLDTRFRFTGVSDHFSYSGISSAILGHGYHFNAGFKARIGDYCTGSNHAVSASCLVFAPHQLSGSVMVLSVKNNEGIYIYETKAITPTATGEWNAVRSVWSLPVIQSPDDTIEFYLWDRNPAADWFVDNLNLEFYVLKDRNILQDTVTVSLHPAYRGINLFDEPSLVILENKFQFFGPPWFNLKVLNECEPGTIVTTAEIFTNEWYPTASLVAAQYNADSLILYQSCHLSSTLRKGRWIKLSHSFSLPVCYDCDDVLRIYFYNPDTSQPLMTRNVKIFLDNSKSTVPYKFQRITL